LEREQMTEPDEGADRSQGSGEPGAGTTVGRVRPQPMASRRRRDRISGAAIGALVSGILGMTGCPIFMSIVAITLGRIEIDAIEHGSSPRPGRGLAFFGLVLGILGLVFWGIAGLALLIWYIIEQAGRAI
jgi:hypothetical protein